MPACWEKGSQTQRDMSGWVRERKGSVRMRLQINPKYEAVIELEKSLKKSLQILGKLVIINELTKQRAVTSAG